MGLVRAMGALITLLITMMSGAAVAHAHAGHAHAVSHAKPASISTTSMLRADTRQPVRFERHSLIEPPADGHFGVEPTPVLTVSPETQHESGTGLPGACCGHGTSSCGMTGHHCCASALLHRAYDWHRHTTSQRAPIPHQAFQAPDVVFGLERPPKA